MIRTLTPQRTQAGFSIVELMVGTVVAMLAILVIFNAFAMFEGQKRSTTSTSDVQATGMLALQALERDIRMGGYGMTINNQLMTTQLACTTMTTYTSGTATTNIPFLPVSITDGGTNNKLSDSITAMYGTSAFSSTPAVLTAATSTVGSDVIVSNTAGTAVFNTNNYFLLAQPLASGSKPCIRMRVTSVDNLGPSNRLNHASTDAANPSGSAAMVYDDSATAPAVVINMGSMQRPQYTVSGTNLTYQDLNTGSSAVSVASGVVALKAQYGINIDAAKPQAVGAWVDAVNIASGTNKGTWNAPDSTLVPRIKAVRVAIVVRSSLLEKDVVTTTCANNAGTNKGPCAWKDSSANPAPLIDLSGDANWQYYRYRVFETIIPLRNVIWGNA